MENRRYTCTDQKHTYTHCIAKMSAAYKLLIQDAWPLFSSDISALIAFFMKEEIWCVTVTEFIDDNIVRHRSCYRDRDWSTSAGPYLFHGYDTAQQFLQRKLYDWCYPQIEDVQDDDPKRMLELKSARNDWRALKEFTRELAAGQYVRRRLAWTLRRVEYED